MDKINRMSNKQKSEEPIGFSKSDPDGFVAEMFTVKVGYTFELTWKGQTAKFARVA